MRIGVISDTHGLLRPEAVAALAGCGLILHAGDIGAPEVLAALERIAPVHAVRGNVDLAAWARGLPERRTVEAAGSRFHLLHDLKRLPPASAPWDAVVSGHTHRAIAEARGGVLFLNPGSAGPRRFRLPVTLALLDVHDGELHPRIVPLAV